MVDGQVFREINRGNAKMAEPMKNLKASGARIALGEAVRTEMLGQQQSNAQKRVAHEAMLQDFGVEIAPPDLRTTRQARLPYLEKLAPCQPSR